ncbi:hypothetical protein [Ekhidna sp.]
MEKIEPKSLDPTIYLKWIPGSFDQNDEEIRTGFMWVLSSLGATLPNGSMGLVMVEEEELLYKIDLAEAGFSDKALEAFDIIIRELKNSEAYKVNGFTEMGRFVMLTLNSSYHYYQIVQMPIKFSTFESLYEFEGKQLQVINSAVSDVQRLVEISEADRIEEVAYIATEGQGSFEEGTFEAEEFEVFDFMPNGQIRFGIYDKDGNLKMASNPELTQAGKPSKCLWCHEISIQPFFTSNPVLNGDGFLSEEQFADILDQQNLFLAEHRASLNSEINFFNLQDHRFQEYLYIDFMEPSLARIAIEWGMTVTDVTRHLANVSTHTQSEYGIEMLYDRKDIDIMAPYSTIEVPESAREFSENEPNFFD